MIIFWFRNDLRVSDNPGLSQAATEGRVMPVFIFEEESAKSLKMGATTGWWLHHSLKSLNTSLQGKLNFYQGNVLNTFEKLLHRHEVKAVYWSRCYEPSACEQEKRLKELLQFKKIPFQGFNASLLWEPEQVLKKDKKPYQVFTPFYREALSEGSSIRPPLLAPQAMQLMKDENSSKTIDSLQLLSNIPWHEKLDDYWHIGEQAAHQRLSSFLKNDLIGYQKNRDLPALSITSRLSPHLHFGEISPHQIWDATCEIASKTSKRDGDAFLRELAWREFSYYQLFHFPELPWKNFQSKFDRFPWHHDEVLLQAWQQGKTGFPIVDAGMRELWQTGTMHNRVRMIVASFLTKNLLIDWRDGAAWFYDCLVDADLATNSLNWQWVAGCGVDAAPYFRIFNPILQGKKFDPDGVYIRQFLPELRNLSKKFLFAPWEASQTILNDAGIILGKTYPFPIVDLQVSRSRAMQAYHVL